MRNDKFELAEIELFFKEFSNKFIVTCISSGVIGHKKSGRIVSSPKVLLITLSRRIQCNHIPRVVKIAVCEYVVL